VLTALSQMFVVYACAVLSRNLLPELACGTLSLACVSPYVCVCLLVCCVYPPPSNHSELSSLPLDVMKGLDTAARLCQYDIRLSMVTSLTMLLSPRTDSASPTFSLDGSSSHAREHLLSTILPLVCATLRFVIESEPGLLGELAAAWHYLPTCAFQRVVVVLNYADLLSFFFPLLL
jgi:hypothetical protein